MKYSNIEHRRAEYADIVKEEIQDQESIDKLTKLYHTDIRKTLINLNNLKKHTVQETRTMMYTFAGLSSLLTLSIVGLIILF